VTVTKNEILYSLNKPEDFILGIVEFLDGDQHRVHYVRRPFHREPDFGVTIQRRQAISTSTSPPTEAVFGDGSLSSSSA
jgi:hypothetical protein